MSRVHRSTQKAMLGLPWVSLPEDLGKQGMYPTAMKHICR